MFITRVETLGLFTKLRQVPLKGFDRHLVYENCDFSLERLNPNDLTVCQNYVLKPILEAQKSLWESLLEKGIDVTRLTKDHYVDWNGESIPVLPPIVEESFEAGGKTVLLINDGLHRVTYAKTNNKSINVVVVRGVKQQYPYYAYPTARNWDSVEFLNELPPNYVKKTYRYPDRYKDYYRDFNSVFPGIQKDRPIPTV